MGCQRDQTLRLIPLRHISITSWFHRGIRYGYMVTLQEIEFFLPQLIQGKFGKAIDLNGEYFDMPIKADQETDSNGLSVAVWMYPRQVSGGFDNEKTIFSTNNSGFDWSTTMRFGAIQVWNGNIENKLHSPWWKTDGITWSLPSIHPIVESISI